MRTTDDLADVAPEQRLAELASIFAAGILRLRTRGAVPASDPAPENPPESRPGRLELPAKTVLSVHGG
jgi:hypothetical protein